MHRILTAIAAGGGLGLVLASGCGTSSTAPASQVVAWSAPAPPNHSAGPARRASCTSGGNFDWGTRQSTSTSDAWAQADWEALPQPEPLCSTQIRVRVLSAAGFNYRSGWVKALELNTRATATDGSQMTGAWAEAQYTGNPATRSCERIYPTQGSWFGCPNGGRKITRALRISREQAPECNPLRLVTPSGQSIWLQACGSGPSHESQAQDWARQSLARQTAIMDGVTALTPANCPQSAPCVLIGQNTPAS